DEHARHIWDQRAPMSTVSSIVLAALFAWPWLRANNRRQAPIWLIAPHRFLRFIALSFLVPGVVSISLPKASSGPAGYGDLIGAESGRNGLGANRFANSFDSLA